MISSPPVMVNRRFTLTGFKNVSDDYPVLWQSGSYMNTSGPAVKRVWDKWRDGRDAEEVCLIVVHDELEKDLGKVSVKIDGQTASSK
jgi:peptidyl-tRNA hydrolase